MIFLSTSRVYSVAPLSALNVTATDTRYELSNSQTTPGASAEGIAEDFPVQQYRSLYGTTKLAAEMFIEEYRQAYGLKALINRCGVLAGPWQLARSDQGIFTFWMARHYFGRELNYIGFGGRGLQVRDLLHIDDLCALIVEQVRDFSAWDGSCCNVGGGLAGSLSLAETTALCREISGREVPVTSRPESRPMDIPVYLSDCRRLFTRTAWRPRRTPRMILQDIHDWIAREKPALLASA
jgi:CDP-paratose 2-epimerase